MPPSPRRTPAAVAVIADDHPLVATALREILEGGLGLRIAAMAGNGVEAIAAAGRWRPALMTLDLAMPLSSGLETLQAVLAASPATRVVVVTGMDAPGVLADVLAAGDWDRIEALAAEAAALAPA